MGNSRFRNKCLSMLIVFVLIFTVGMPVFAIGDVNTDTVFTVGTATANAGASDVEIPILVEDCESFVALGLSFVYDDTALTLVDIVKSPELAGTLVKNVATDKILNFDWDEAAFEDGEIFILKFDVSPYAQTGVYSISAEISRNGWNNNENDDLIPQGFVDGSITVTGLNVAQVGDEEYETIGDALAGAIDLEGPATVTMLANAVIADESDRIVIPDGADITWDMDGYTITSSLPAGIDDKGKPVASADLSVVEVKAGGKLNLVDSSDGERGGFAHTSGDQGTLFLANTGELNMENIKVSNFNQGISDISSLGGTGYGTYGTIKDCIFDIESPDGSVAFYLKDGKAETIDGLEIYGAKRAITVGKTGVIELLKDCVIEGDIESSTLIYINAGGVITEIKDCSIELFEHGYAIESGGHIGIIDGGRYATTGYTIWNGLWGDGSIGEIAAGDFVGGNTCIMNRGHIDEISGGTFTGGWEGVIKNEYDEASIDTISGGIFINDSSSPALWNNCGAIGNITGGEFSSMGHYAFYVQGGTVESISGGTFYAETYNALRLGFTCYTYDENEEPGLIESISGGTFISGNSSAVFSEGFLGQGNTIEEITGGTFIGKGGYGLGLRGGNVDGISGGVFDGKAGAIGFYHGPYNEWSGWDDDWNDIYEDFYYSAAIGDISGGYYRALDGEELIVIPEADEESEWICADGHGFATVPLRPQDLPANFPDEELIEERTGFYHFGQTADITWDIDGDETVDKFVIGDQVYYAHDEPTKEGDEGVDFRFKGWHDGTAQYKPNQLLPVALQGGATYTAVFEQIGSEVDYQVSLGTDAENINAGEPFTVDVIVSSEGNENFYGATVVIGYDKDKVEFDDANTIYGSGFGPYSKGNSDTTRGILGSQIAGYTLTDGDHTIANIGFKAKKDIAVGKTAAVFRIEDKPVVDQQMGFESIEVDKGDDISVNLYNLTVTFSAGENTTMEDVTAYVKYNDEGLYIDNDYEDTLEEPALEVAGHYIFKGWKLDDEYHSFKDIEEMTFTENTTFTATATPLGYTIELPECVNIISGAEDGQVIHGTDVVFTVTDATGYKVNKVTYTIGVGEVEEIDLVEGKYTIPGNKVTDDITVEVTQHIDGSIEFIPGEDFNSLPADHQLLTLTVADKLDGSAYEYNEDSMFYSGKYSNDGEQVYLYIVPNDVSEEGAREAIQIVEGPACYELKYNGDINLDGEVNSTDVVIVFALYQGLWEDKSFPNVTPKENMQARLEADVNGDRKVNTTDAQMILNISWGSTN